MPYVAIAQDRDVASARISDDLSALHQSGALEEADAQHPIAEVNREAVSAEAAEHLAEQTNSSPPDATPVSLPGAETPSAVSPQSITLPSGEGSIQGMGESFSPVLSSGTATFSVPIAVAPGRAGVQPSLSLAYSTSGGNGPVGFGWGMGVPFISRQTDRGLPRYVDRAAWHPEEDRFIYNGGQELVPVDASAMATVDGQASGAVDASPVPTDVVGWQQYRARVEGGFMRFFRAPPDAHGQISRWIVQSKDGTRFDFGLLPTGDGPSDATSASSRALESDPEAGTHVFRWMLTRMSDAHGSTVYYEYHRDRQQLYLDDVYYVSPADCASNSPDTARRCTSSLSAYGAHVHLTYESRDDAFTSYLSGYPVTTGQRLTSVVVTAYDDGAGQRTLVRRYHLAYEPGSYHSLLHSVQVEGRPHDLQSDVGVYVGRSGITESMIDSVTGPMLPPMVFGYSDLPSGTGAIDGFGALSSSVRALTASPPHSIDDALTDFFDVNSDGLPDLIVTDPARYRTHDGQPAVGVFFNGFTGADAQPGIPGNFSGAVPMPMRSDLSGTLSLTNLNIVPMDIDGDGRSDLLHMPRQRSYGWFAPTRQADTDGAPAHVSPAQQGWRWTYATIDLPSTDLDPRIDFGRDSSHFEIMDVNQDHLVDVVRTTGTEIQTWLNLGWIPEHDASGRGIGDGRFGTAHYDGAHWLLSTQPTSSCLLTAGTALDFADSETRLADMNGDNLVDLVRVRQGRVIWWPSRGTGSYGVGNHDCTSGTADNRYIEMTGAPTVINAELDGVQLADVDGDGASDLVQVRTNAIDVWFNRAGSGFTDRFIVNGTPAAPDFLPRVRLMDIDGSGTIDAVYANAGHYQFVDLLNHTAPRMLTTVDNGLGALTTIEYDTSVTDYLGDLQAASSTCTDESTGCDRFVWSRVEGGYSTRLQRRAPGEPTANMFHGAGTPVISTVVRSIRTSDRFGVYSQDQVSQTRFGYHDGYYEGIEQEFRGFGAADSITIGDETSPSVLTRTWFNQGRRPQDIADDRLAYSDDEALKGREYLTEVLDENGVYLSTSHATLTSRTLATGLDGRPIQYAFVSQSDEIRYDTTGYTPLNAVVQLADVERQTVDATTGAHNAATVDRMRDVRVRGDRSTMIRTTYDEVDNLGQVLSQTAHGRVFVDGVGMIFPADQDPAITSVTVPVLQNGAAWIWRTHESYVLGSLTGAAGMAHLHETTNTYSSAGDLIASVQAVSSPRTYDFSSPDAEGDQGDAPGLTQSDDALRSSSIVDYWGQPIATCVGGSGTGIGAVNPSFTPGVGACLRYSTVTRDEAFQQLALVEHPYVASGTYLATQGVWDRGLGVLVEATDPNSLVTTVTYDGLGRLTSVTPPNATGCTTATPTTRISYELTSSPSSQPASRVVTTTELDCDGTLGEATVDDDPGSLVSIGYVDGLGRVRATLATGGDDSTWVRAGLSRLDTKGAVAEAWQTDYYDGSDTSFSGVLALPGESWPHTRSVYDAFGRVRVAYAEDGAMTTTSYHTLSTDVCDPLDNDPSSMHVGTCTTARTDGHGRLIDQILRNRQPGVSDTEYHRLWTFYRNDGAVLELVRLQSEDASDLRPTDTSRSSAESAGLARVHRTFFYDTVGRRIGSDDPDTNNPEAEDPDAASWRYLFNAAGDLAAVRDPRGCGQNFYYDLGGRLVGEQYVACDESQTTASELPTQVLGSALGMTIASGALVDVQYFYDALPSWVGGADLDVDPPSSAPLLGRATGVADRAQQAAVSYDDRGNAVWTARQVAVISAELAFGTHDLSGTTVRGAPDYDFPLIIETPPSTGSNVAYDEAHTYVRTAAFDHAGRPTTMALPRDPDWDATTFIDDAPLIAGRLAYNARGLPASADLSFYDGDDRATYTSAMTMPSQTVSIVRAIHYLRDGLVSSIEYGEIESSSVVTSGTEYDQRRRPTHMSASRAATGIDLQAVTTIADQHLVWDAASNLTAILDERDPAEWPAGYRPQSVEIEHDSLYRVVGALFDYTLPGESEGSTALGSDTGSDWRGTAAASNAADPMHPDPAPMMSDTPPDRVQSLVWSWDWLGNMTEWNDDAQQFYERSIGEITNGYAVSERPSALYLSSNVGTGDPDSNGWVELDYGVGGNVTAVTVHAQCGDAGMDTCADPGGGDYGARREALRSTCDCQREQHYQYRWDELNRISEARRFDREGGAGGGWTIEARQRYRYDGANVRVVKQSFDTASGVTATDNRVALYVYPGDFERRGLERSGTTYVVNSDTSAPSETQYMVAGSRMVWTQASAPEAGTDLDVPHRITVPVSDLLHTTTASVDLWSGDLLEVSTYYPNGARETLRVDEGIGATVVPLEPTGFTGKEADEDVGLVYFGERYLVARLARWASADPAEIHANSGGQVLNYYHYVGGGLLSSTDPIGLCGDDLSSDECARGMAAAIMTFGLTPDAVLQLELHGMRSRSTRLRDVVPRVLQPGVAVVEAPILHMVKPGREAQALVDHYLAGSGHDLSLTADQVQELGSLSALGRSRSARDLVNPLEQAIAEQVAHGGGVIEQGEYQISQRATQAGTLGEYGSTWRGRLEVRADGGWSFTGTVSIHDEYDFDPKPWGERDPGAEYQTRMGDQLMVGQGFHVTSDDFAVAVSSDDPHAHISSGGGRTPAAPMGLGQADVALVDGLDSDVLQPAADADSDANPGGESTTSQ